MAQYDVFADDRDLQSLLDLGDNAVQATQVAAQALAAATYGHIQELAHERLHNRLAPFLDALEQRTEDDAFLVVLGAKASWIDDGLEPYDMHESLLRSPHAKVSKNGHRYMSIPFEQAHTGSSPRPLSHSNLADTVRAQLKKAGVTATKIERDASGAPKMGRLHSVPLIHGPGDEGQLPPYGPLAKRGRALTSGLTVYQHPANNKAGAVRSVVTFRTISEGSEGWRHPGLKATHIFEDSARWAEDTWEREVWPALLESLTGIKTMGR